MLERLLVRQNPAYARHQTGEFCASGQAKTDTYVGRIMNIYIYKSVIRTSLEGREQRRENESMIRTALWEGREQRRENERFS
jgi:hypothetical protein